MDFVQSKKVRLLLGAVVIAATAVALRSLPIKSDSKPQIQQIVKLDAQIYQFSQKQKTQDSAIVSVNLIEPEKERAVYTIYLDIDDDGQFTDEEKVVDEVPAQIENNLPSGFPIILDDKQQLNKFLALAFDQPIRAKIIADEISQIVKTKKISLDIGEIFDPARGFSGYSTVFAQENKDLSKVPASNTAVPDLDGRKGKPNECVPLSLANSLIWLAEKHKFADKIPANSDDLIDELAKDLKWTKEGVKNENILPGKEAFTKRRKLPLVNKKIDNEVVGGESQLWERIVAELDSGEDVELLIDFKQSPRGKAEKGHAVTVVAADKSKKGKQQISIHDPATPKGSETYEIDRNGQVIGYPLGKVYVNFIISESFTTETPSPTPSLSPTPSPTPTPRKTPTTQPTNAPTATNIPIQTATPTPSLTPAPTLTVSPTPSVTSTVSPLPTPSPTPSPIHFPSPS